VQVEGPLARCVLRVKVRPAQTAVPASRHTGYGHVAGDMILIKEKNIHPATLLFVVQVQVKLSHKRNYPRIECGSAIVPFI
jgi:hypothetical protein